jgi:hypothetical protein
MLVLDGHLVKILLLGGKESPVFIPLKSIDN